MFHGGAVWHTRRKGRSEVAGAVHLEEQGDLDDKGQCPHQGFPANDDAQLRRERIRRACAGDHAPTLLHETQRYDNNNIVS